MSRAGASIALALVALASGAASAQRAASIESDNSAAADLYLERRPRAQGSPRLPAVLERRLLAREREADARRREAVGLLRGFLASEPTGDGRAEGKFKLAELLWEDARRAYVRRVDAYQAKLERCQAERRGCAPGKEPELDLAEPERLYKEILAERPDYRRADLVLYLIGFAAREDGRAEEAQGYFEKVITGHRTSPLYADAWMMLAEDHFVAGRWGEARRAYLEVLERPTAQSYDLALFKTAWCEWKLGDSTSAARRFKLVLDLAAESERSGDERQRRRRTQLRDEALDYLVVVFSEDESIAPKDVYQFLASIGGAQYSEAILVRLGQLFFDQAAYPRAVATWRYLIEVDPARLAAATYQRRIVDAELAALDGDSALAEIKVLVEGYGAASPWAGRHEDRPRAIKQIDASNEALVRRVAKEFHAEAQTRERTRKRADQALYARTAATYAFYLTHFARYRAAAEIRFLRAELLLFKLGQPEQAGDEYLAVGKVTPVGKYHKDALLKAMAAYKKARAPGPGGAPTKVDEKFAEAIDLYATLFPADPEIVGVIFENGQLFYERGQYDEAVKRFGLIVTRYPNDPNAAAAGDRILSALSRAEDYANIETWARKLKAAPAFARKDEQARLDRLIGEAIFKRGEQQSAAGELEAAARTYLRLKQELPRHALAAQATFNAAVMFEKARQPETAADTYLQVAGMKGAGELGGKAAMTAAQVYESVAYFEQAAAAYERVARDHARASFAADAQFNAGVLRQALGEWKKAIDHYATYAKRYRKSKDDAGEVAFRIGVVYEEAGDAGRAERAFADYLRTYRGGAHELEATVRAGRTALRLGQETRARERFKEAIARWRRSFGEARKQGTRWAAEARYHEGELLYREYAKLSLDVRPSQLDRVLKRKMKLLDDASVIYLDVVQVGDPQWGTGALYRIGSVMEEFARALRDAPVPRGLSEAEQGLYREALDNQVVDVEEKAIELYTVGYQKALGLKVYNEFTRKIREALGRMAASQFPPMKESREPMRIGDRAVEITLVKEVVR